MPIVLKRCLGWSGTGRREVWAIRRDDDEDLARSEGTPARRGISGRDRARQCMLAHVQRAVERFGRGRSLGPCRNVNRCYTFAKSLRILDDQLRDLGS